MRLDAVITQFDVTLPYPPSPLTVALLCAQISLFFLLFLLGFYNISQVSFLLQNGESGCRERFV